MAGLNLFTNNASTTLASGISAVDTSLTVSSGTGSLFPTLAGSQYFYTTLSNVAATIIEIVKVTARSGDTFTIVRGQDNTTASAYITGDKVELRLVDASLENFPQLDSTNTFTQTQTFVAPILGTPTSGTLTNCTFPTLNQNTTGTAAGLSATLAVASGGTGRTTNTAYAVICGGTTTGGVEQSIASVGTSGQVLMSNGASTLPTFQTISTQAFPSGTRMSFQQTTAPTGWTKDTTAAINDSMLRLVTGAASSGGTTAFSTWSAVTATGATTLSISEIPSHDHPYPYQVSEGASGTAGAYTYGPSPYTSPSSNTKVAPQGGGGSHTHSLTRSLKYYDFIIATAN